VYRHTVLVQAYSTASSWHFSAANAMHPSGKGLSPLLKYKSTEVYSTENIKEYRKVRINSTAITWAYIQ